MKIIELTDDKVQIFTNESQEFKSKYTEYIKYITELGGDNTLNTSFIEVEFDSLMPKEQLEIENAID